MYQLRIEQSFDSAHFLAGYQGKCGNIHGHRWTVALSVESEELQDDIQQRGMCVDFSELKEALRKEVDYLDHKFIIEKGSLKEHTLLALQSEGFEMVLLDFRPTAENFAKYFYDKFKQSGYSVSRIEVYETPNNHAVYYES